MPSLILRSYVDATKDFKFCKQSLEVRGGASIICNNLHAAKRIASIFNDFRHPSKFVFDFCKNLCSDNLRYSRARNEWATQGVFDQLRFDDSVALDSISPKSLAAAFNSALCLPGVPPLKLSFSGYWCWTTLKLRKPLTVLIGCPRLQRLITIGGV